MRHAWRAVLLQVCKLQPRRGVSGCKHASWKHGRPSELPGRCPASRHPIRADDGELVGGSPTNRARHALQVPRRRSAHVEQRQHARAQGGHSRSRLPWRPRRDGCARRGRSGADTVAGLGRGLQRSGPGDRDPRDQRDDSDLARLQLLGEAQDPPLRKKALRLAEQVELIESHPSHRNRDTGGEKWDRVIEGSREQDRLSRFKDHGRESPSGASHNSSRTSRARSNRNRSGHRGIGGNEPGAERFQRISMLSLPRPNVDRMKWLTPTRRCGIRCATE